MSLVLHLIIQLPGAAKVKNHIRQTPKTQLCWHTVLTKHRAYLFQERQELCTRRTEAICPLRAGPEKPNRRTPPEQDENQQERENCLGFS